MEIAETQEVTIDEDLAGMNLSDLYLNHVYFAQTQLTSVIFGNSDISYADFKKSKGFNYKQIAGCLNIDKAYLSSKPAPLTTILNQRKINYNKYIIW